MLFIMLKSSHHGTEMILFSYAACVGSNEYSLHIKNIFINKITGSSMQCSFWEIEVNYQQFMGGRHIGTSSTIPVLFLDLLCLIPNFRSSALRTERIFMNTMFLPKNVKGNPI